MLSGFHQTASTRSGRCVYLWGLTHLPEAVDASTRSGRLNLAFRPAAKRENKPDLNSDTGKPEFLKDVKDGLNTLGAWQPLSPRLKSNSNGNLENECHI
jgi:hypothetical protein